MGNVNIPTKNAEQIWIVGQVNIVHGMMFTWVVLVIPDTILQTIVLLGNVKNIKRHVIQVPSVAQESFAQAKDARTIALPVNVYRVIQMIKG